MGFSQLYPNVGNITSVSSAPYTGQTWVNPTNVATNNTTNATITDAAFDNGVYSYLLKCQNFGFAVPAGATITGVEVWVECQANAGTAAWDMVQLLNASGTAEGNNKAAALALATGAITVQKFGDPRDQWGISLTPTIVNDEDFGVQLAVKATAADTDVLIDYVSIIVSWTAPYTCLDPGDWVAYPAEFLTTLMDIPAMVTGFDYTHPVANLDWSSNGMTLAGGEEVYGAAWEGGGIVVPTEGQIWPRGNW